MGGKSPTQRSLDYCRAQGWPAGIVEHWNAHAFMRFDLFGVIDLIVLDNEPGVLGVQACAGSSHATRAVKMHDTIAGRVTGSAAQITHRAAENKAAALQKWLAKGNRLSVWSWAKQGPRGSRKTWTLRVEQIGAYAREEGARPAT